MSFQFVGAGIAQSNLGAPSNINNASRIITVPSGVTWKIGHIYYSLSTTATVGGRVAQVFITADTSLSFAVVEEITWPFSAVASTNYVLETVPWLAYSTFVAGTITHALAPWEGGIWVPSGGQIYPLDRNARDGADQVTTGVSYEEYRYVADSAPVTVFAPTASPVNNPSQ